LYIVRIIYPVIFRIIALPYSCITRQSRSEKLKFQHLQGYYALDPEKQPAKSAPLLLDPSSAHQTVIEDEQTPMIQNYSG